jgi:hypothetical protein
MMACGLAMEESLTLPICIVKKDQPINCYVKLKDPITVVVKKDQYSLNNQYIETKDPIPIVKKDQYFFNNQYFGIRSEDENSNYNNSLSHPFLNSKDFMNEIQHLEEEKKKIQDLQKRIDNLSQKNQDILNENSRLLDLDSCIVCTENKAEFMFPDCRHLCLCENCANNVALDSENGGYKCYICRQQNTEAPVRVFRD